MKPTEPVAACLCGLDTNPVASPRMDIHCPKHDAPEAGSEPELQVSEAPKRIWIHPVAFKTRSSVTIYDERWREPNDIEYVRADIRAAQPSPTPADELNYDAAFRATDSTTAVASYQDCSGSATPLEPNRGWDDAEQGLMPTPADEEVAREIPRICVHCDEPIMVVHAASHIAECYESHLNYERAEDTITTALAEARRAGTPTTEAAFEDWLNCEDYGDREQLQRCWNAAVRYASALSSTPSVDDYVAWCRYVNHGTDDSGADILTIEICDSDAKDAFKVYRSTSSEQSCKQCGCTHATAYELGRQDERSATPGDEVAQRARAAAEEIVASISVNDFRNIQSFNRYDRLTDVILKHFTATDGTCTWTWTGTERVTACGAQTRDFGLVDFKFCAFCGKPLAEATREVSDG